MSPWGTHFCQFYRTREDLLEILIPYFRCGLEHNEFCMWVTSDPLTTDGAVEAMRAAWPGFDPALRRGQIEILPHTDWYLRDGQFDGERVLAAWVAKLEAAQARGYDGLRLTGNTFWLEQSNWRDFADYEEIVNRMIGKYQMTALCAYSLDRCGSLDIVDVVMTHQFALIKRDGAWTLIEPSERKAAAEMIEKANEALVHDLRSAQCYTRSLIEASVDPLVTISSTGKITDVNEATVGATGVPREQLIGSDFASYFTEPEKASAGYQQAFHLGTVRDYPLVLRHVSGRTTDVHYNASVYRDADGRVEGVFAAARDVTERNRAESGARRLAAIVESSDDAIMAQTVDGVILTWNPAAQALYGYTAEEIVGRPITVLVPPDLHEELDDLTCRVVRGEHVAHEETRRLPREGPPVDVSLSVSPLLDTSGQVVGVSTIARDITERKRAERQLRAASAYNRSLIEASLDPLVTIEPGGTITDVNAATEQVTGYSRAELIGTEFSAYFTDPGLARAGYERVFQDGTVRDYPLDLRHRDGDTTPVLYNASVYRDDAGKVLGVFAAARDVTAQRAAEAEVLALNAELEARVQVRTCDLEQATRSMEAFAYSVSHDLRAPLRALSGYSEVLLEDCAATLDEEGRDYARRIAAAAQRMARLIDDLLHLSRVSRAEMHLQQVDLSAQVMSIAEDLQRSEPQRRARFLVAPAIHATADLRLIRTVLENLVGNAWKFTSRRDEAVIEFGSLPNRDAEVCCYVRDDGAGFDANYLGKLFQPFQRLHTAQQFPGNGIGLASVRRIVERHGGRIWAEGQVDHGATFHFTLNAGPKDHP